MIKQNDMDINNVPRVVLACCILNNICEIHGDTVLISWLDDTSENQPTSTPPSASTARNAQASIIRDTLVQYMS